MVFPTGVGLDRFVPIDPALSERVPHGRGDGRKSARHSQHGEGVLQAVTVSSRAEAWVAARVPPRRTRSAYRDDSFGPSAPNRMIWLTLAQKLASHLIDFFLVLTYS